MAGKTSILIVEDERLPRENLVQELGAAFPESTILTAEDMETARELLRQNSVMALVTDNSFPASKTGFLENGGLQLLEELRRGDFGEVNKVAPTFFQTGGMNDTIEEVAHALGGFNQCYSKAHANMGKQIAQDLKAVLSGEKTEPTPYKVITDESQRQHRIAMGLEIPAEAPSSTALPAHEQVSIRSRLAKLLHLGGR